MIHHPYENNVVYRTAELFLEQDKIKLKVGEIADQVNKELKPARRLTRESIYRVLAQAKSDGIIKLVPPVDEQLKIKLKEHFTRCFANFTVVSTQGNGDNAKVAEVAADKAFDLVRKIKETRNSQSVGIGLGPGRATLDFCRYFGSSINVQDFFPKLRLVAITAGCPATQPEYASSSFFHFFPDNLVAERIGLFAESLVRSKDFPSIKRAPGVREAFEAKKSDVIDVVVTSMGDFSDKHDLLGEFLQGAGMDENEYAARKWVGNIQYRPYTASQPVVEGPKDWQAVTLFEIEDLVKMKSQKNKHVILIARQCGICGKTRAKSLSPLLNNPDLCAFSELVIDVATARELLQTI